MHRDACLLVAVLLFVVVEANAYADQHLLRDQGRTLVEAEQFSTASSDTPRTEASPWCSGQKNLGYFWRDTWFELKLDVPRMLNYSISLRACSPAGTQIELQILHASGMQSIATIDIPKTKSWVAYVDTDEVIVSLPSGVNTLRFLNQNQSANIDYVTFLAGSFRDVPNVVPAVNSGPDRNPLKGFSSGWQRSNDDFATVGFQRIEWGLFEPQDDIFDWEYIERLLDADGSRDRHFILQFIVDVDDWEAMVPEGRSHYRGPDWLLERVGENRGPANPEDPKSRITRATRYDDRMFIEESTEAIKTLLDRYRDDPRAFVFQAGVLGFWGKWSTQPRTDWAPTQFTKSEILNAYVSNLGGNGLTQIQFPRDPLHSPRASVGYSSSFGAPIPRGYEFCEHVSNERLWINGPISGDWPPNQDKKVFESLFQDAEGMFFIEQGSFSTLMLPEVSKIREMLPDWKQDECFMNMQRRLGYNFQVKAVRHLVAIDRSKCTFIEVDLQNIGIAPFYKTWKVQLGILNAQTHEPVEIINTDTDLRKLKPNEMTTVSAVFGKEHDPRIPYQIGLRLLQPGADESKESLWKLNPRNTYIVLANQIEVIDGVWEDGPGSEKKWNLKGGWNLIDTVRRREPEEAALLDSDFFPFQGSFRR
jgi:hypothetical protein